MQIVVEVYLRMRKICGAMLAILIGISSTTIAHSADNFFTIGTGGVTGVYYPAGAAVCRYVNRGRQTHGLRCSVEATGGSIYNVRALRNGELDFGVAQSDWLYHARHGTSVFKRDGEFADLRMVFALHTEVFTIIARRDSGIETLDDLLEKRVNISNPGSGSRATLQALMDLKGWTKRDFALASELKASEQAQALCDNKVDAVTFVIGHPSGTVKEATANCDTVFVPIDAATLKILFAKHPFYVPASIPGDLYTNTEVDISSFGVRAVLLTSAQVDEEIVHELVSSVMNNLEAYRQVHFAFRGLTPESMSADLGVDYHKGAQRYWNETQAEEVTTH